MNWYEAAFRSEYLRVYRHRDAASAAREADFLVRTASLEAGSRVLDLACGSGRHARPLREAGCRVAALDLSPELLIEAVRQGTRGLARGDMRSLPFPAGTFDGAASFFTSFGYFADQAEDRRVLAEVTRVLAPGGRYLLDLMNRDRAVKDLVPRSVDRIEGCVLVQERSFDEPRGRIRKAVTIRQAGCSTPLASYVESVRVYFPEEIEAMLEDAGLAMESRFGDLEGSSFDPAVSSRLVVLGRKV